MWLENFDPFCMFLCLNVWLTAAKNAINKVCLLLKSTDNNQQHCYWTHHAAPTTDNAIANPIPREPHINGEVFSKNLKDGNRTSLIFHCLCQGAKKVSFKAWSFGFSHSYTPAQQTKLNFQLNASTKQWGNPCSAPHPRIRIWVSAVIGLLKTLLSIGQSGWWEFEAHFW